MSPAVLLALAIVSEVFGTVMLRVSDGMSKLLPSVGTLVAYTISVYLLALVLKHLDIGLTYAIWAGVGTAMVAVIGVAVWDEPMSTLKVLSIVAVIAGVIGLNLSGAH
ncbi:MAG TPA: multidrug efflux SMR transporter [Solirubrobacteraceae bacterium]|nr:multidrug efflux SMR transporter [Solirubrobacteraceae bacterium]